MMGKFQVELEDGRKFIVDVEGNTPPTEAEIMQFLGQQPPPVPPQREFATNPSTEAIQEAFPSTMAPRSEKMGEIGGFVGEVGGTAAAAALPGGGFGRGLARIGLAGLGAGVGSQAERLLRSGKLDLKQGALEAVLSAGPQAAEEVVRGTLRGALRWTRGGRELASDEAARVAEGIAGAAFHPPSKAHAQQLFAIFDTPITGSLSRAKLVIDALEEGGVKNRLIRQLKALDTNATETLLAGGDLTLKQLQEFRSLIGDQALRIGGQVGGARTQRLMKTVQRRIDAAIDAQLDLMNLPGEAQSAREAWHRLKAAERLHDLIAKPPITRFTDPTSDRLEFNILSLRNQLLADRGQLAKRVNMDLAKLPGAQEGFESFLRRLQAVIPSGKLEFSDVSGARRLFAVAALDRMVSGIITSPVGQSLFLRAAAYGRGRMAFNTVAILFNLVRRQELGAGAPIAGMGTAQRLGAGQPFFGATSRGQGLVAPPTVP